jgi:hypothetical protein
VAISDWNVPETPAKDAARVSGTPYFNFAAIHKHSIQYQASQEHLSCNPEA